MFWAKKKGEVQEMKQAVAGPTQPFPQAPQPEPQMAPMKIAPLFVKVDKYKDILETVAKLKGTLKNIDSVLKARQAIDKLRDDADSVLIRQLGACADCARDLDESFAKPPALEQMIVAQPEAIENDMEQLRNRITQISSQLQQME